VAEGALIRMELGLTLDERTLRVEISTDSRALAVVGPSGVGKSTLLRVLAGVEERATGRLVFDGSVWLDTTAGVRVPAWERGVGWVPQDALLFPHLSVDANLRYSASATRTDAGAIADRLGVAHLLGRMPRNLSGGERQRVALGRALLSSPRLLLLDEPFSALDLPRRAEVAAVVREVAAEHHIPLVLISHDDRDAELLADERWHLAEGHLERV